jgi:hypothetical protein
MNYSHSTFQFVSLLILLSSMNISLKLAIIFFSILSEAYKTWYFPFAQIKS